MPYVLALDQGTTSSRAVLFDHAGTAVAVAQQEFPQIYPQPGWVEHDPDDIFESQLAVACAVLEHAGAKAADIAAIGITNQRETALVWDRESGRPLCNAIVWQDRRTAPRCDRLIAEGHEGLVRERTGLVIDAYFSGSKLSHILETVPGARALAEAGRLAFGTVDSWLVHKLSGGKVHVTDVSNASRTMLMNIHTLDWEEDLLRLFGVPRQMLPEIRSSSEVYAPVAEGFALAGVPIAGIAGDQQAALFGQGCVLPGLSKNTYGTGCFLLQNTGTQPISSRHRLVSTVAWQIGGRTEYALEGSVFIGGAVVQWLRDGLGIIERSSDVEALAGSVTDSGGVLLVPAFTGLGAPHWDPYARGLVIGITRGTTAGHLARAALESIAFQVADLLDAVQADSSMRLEELRVDGGASTNDALLHFQADILGVPVVRASVTETTALGAAALAGLAVGFWGSQNELVQVREGGSRFEPALDPERARALRERWNEAVGRAKGWLDTRGDR